MMKLQTAVRKTTVTIAAGTFLMSAIMVVIFALLNHFDWTVVTGALWGAVFAVLNFFLMAVSVQSAADLSAAESSETEVSSESDAEETQEESEDGLKPSRPLSDNAKVIRRKMQLSYTGRMLMLVAAAIIAVVAPCFHTVAAILPLIFPQIIIRIPGVMNKEA